VKHAIKSTPRWFTHHVPSSPSLRRSL
jgi:hypothetical protein